MIQHIFDWIMDFLYDLAVVALMLLPDSPFQSIEFKNGLSAFSDLMSHINYFIPFGQMLGIGAAYITAVAIWYAVRWVLRMVQYID